MATQQAQQQKPSASALDKPVASQGALKELLSRPDVVKSIEALLPRHMTPERMAKVMLSCALQTPNLLKCSQLSLLQALSSCSALGLEPGPAWGHVYLIPFENRKAGRWDVQVIIGYRGYIHLARNSGYVKQIETHVVFEDDTFELVYGDDSVRKLKHIPNWKGKRDAAKSFVVYGIARMKDESLHVEVMSMDEVREIRNRSQNWKFRPNTGPWHDDFLEMARKTVIRRMQKYLPLSPEQADADALDSDALPSGRAGDAVVSGIVTKPHVIEADVTDAIAARAEADAELPETDAPPAHDPVTGEVREPGSDDGAGEPSPAAAEQEPEKGTVDHLLWRVSRASAEQLAELIKEAADLSKDEPRRLEVSKAIAERRKAVRS